MPISDEFAFIQKIIPPNTFQTGLVMGIGDDAALFRTRENTEQIICMDTMVEHVHFKKTTMSPFQIGYKALAVNISDIAAMGGTPLYYLVSIAIPSNWDEQDIYEIYQGMQNLASRFSMDLIGGDTTSTNGGLVITVTVIGEIMKEKHLLRRNARDKDIVFVTGTIGDSAGGLDLLLKNGRNYPYNDNEQFLIHKHQMPVPRVKEGNILAKYERVALNDVSDGLASELYEIAEASGVSIIIEKDKLPLSIPLRQIYQEKAFQYALFGGEDFELVGTCSPIDWENIKRDFEQQKIPIQAIGHVENGPARVFIQEKGSLKILEKKGYNHFKK
jgi:thiamine-monophosphate kinase